MHNKWKLNYIDLFSGPGRCFNRDEEVEIESSPIIALKSRYKFNKCFFVDLKKENIECLKTRCKPFEVEKYFYVGDCNKQIDNIIPLFDGGSLNLAFIDPTGLDVAFSTITKLAQGTKTDLIINFPFNTAIARNLDKFVKQNQSKLDVFMGKDSDWKSGYRGLSDRNDNNITSFFLNCYRKQLVNIGYVETQLGEERLIKSSKKNLPLYFLVFASKNKLGHKFWEQIGDIEPSGQRKMKF